MKLSPFVVYLILQADMIRLFLCLSLCGPAGLLAFVRFLCYIGYDVASPSEKKEAKERLEKCQSWRTIIRLCVSGLLVLGFIPGTRTIAAMVIAPAIVNSKVVQSDIPELYDLAVTALKQSLGKESK